MHEANLNDKCQMTNDEIDPQPGGQTPWWHALYEFMIDHSSRALRHSSFVIRHSPVVLASLLLLLTVASGQAADEPQPGRFLLIFDNSPMLKKNLPQIRQTLDKLFANNLQHEIQDNDDLGVWTVDQSLHTGEFPLASWSPADSAMYAERLGDFLDQQKSTRHASLANVQPLLNRVAKNSERLTVLIFCDSRLLGTPYDSGVNEIITNTAARAKGAPAPLILVLRAYHGVYLGCSVNRSETLNFPKFPPPPKPEPPPVVKPAAVPAPPPVVRPVAISVPSLIIVGTNAVTNVSAVSKASAALAPLPGALVTNATPTNAVPTNTTIPLPPAAPPNGVGLPPVNLMPTAATQQKTSPPAPMAVAVPPPPAVVNLTSPPAVWPASLAESGTENRPTGTSHRWFWAIGGGALAAVGLTGWLVIRARRPRSSLITSSMQNDTRLPPPTK